jgi:hypothetical protein
MSQLFVINTPAKKKVNINNADFKIILHKAKHKSTNILIRKIVTTLLVTGKGKSFFHPYTSQHMDLHHTTQIRKSICVMIDGCWLLRCVEDNISGNVTLIFTFLMTDIDKYFYAALNLRKTYYSGRIIRKLSTRPRDASHFF